MGDVRENDGDHPNTEEQIGGLQDPVGDKPEFMDLMDLHSMINEEGENDELIGYLRIEEIVTGLDNEIIYCRAMDTIYKELPQWKSIPVNDKGQQVPKGSIGKDNQE